MRGIEGKVAVVTGASRGIGAAVARRLAAEGAAVVVNYARRADAAEAVVADIRAAGGRAVAVGADVADPAQVARLFDEAVAAFGRVDVLVNNAGVGAFVPLDEVRPEFVRGQFSVNVDGVLFASQEAARRFGEGGGRIVNLSSVVTDGVPPGGAVYAATKAAVEMVTRALAAELGPRGVTVNAVSPGAVETDMYHDSGAVGFADYMVQRTPLGRIGNVDDIAGPVAFLVSEDARWITGAVIPADGGFRF